MPPRYAYWTILVDEQPTAFRAAAQEDLQPTFKRLKEKHPSARMVWFQNGKIWNSRLDAQEAMRERGERGRAGDSRQGGGFRDRNRDRAPRVERDSSGKLPWAPKSQTPSPQALTPRNHLLRRSVRDAKPAWKPKGDRPQWKPKSDRPQWRPKGDRQEWRPKSDRPQFKPRSDRPQSKPGSDRPNWRPKAEDRRQQDKLEWRPKGSPPSPRPQAQAPRSRPQVHSRTGRDKNWRPGGEHRDPRQKYKDAKKAKWARFKKNIRTRWEAKQQGAPKKRKKGRDEE